MLSKKLFIFFLSGMLFSATTSAALLDFNFSHGGFNDGWIVSGSFSGEDLNNDGILGGYYNFDTGENIGYGEVTSFKYQFSQNGVAFPQFDIDGAGGITYVLDGGLLGDDVVEVIDENNVPDFDEIYELVPVGALFPLGTRQDFNLGPDIYAHFKRSDGEFDENGSFIGIGISGHTTDFAVVTPAMSTVSVPSAVWLFASALFGLFNIKRIQPLSGTQQKI